MQDVINQIISNFDFEKVHKVMILLNWAWSKTYPEVPTIGILVLTAKELLEDVLAEEDGTTIETGGFEAQRFNGEGGKTFLALKFYVDTCQSCSSWAAEEIKKKIKENKDVSTDTTNIR
jgi:hypothetical protein